MTNKKLLLLLISIFIMILFTYFYFGNRPNAILMTSAEDKNEQAAQVTKIRSQVIEHVDNKLNPVPKEKHSKSYVNQISPDWKKKLENSLQYQMGSELKDLKVQPLKELILERDGHALHVQAVLIKIKNIADMESSFNAIIDSQTGKVIETWNQPVFEPELKSPPSP